MATQQSAESPDGTKGVNCKKCRWRRYIKKKLLIKTTFPVPIRRCRKSNNAFHLSAVNLIQSGTVFSPFSLSVSEGNWSIQFHFFRNRCICSRAPPHRFLRLLFAVAKGTVRNEGALNEAGQRRSRWGVT